MIHIDNKYIILGNSTTDLVASVYGNMHENYADHECIREEPMSIAQIQFLGENYLIYYFTSFLQYVSDAN